MHIQSGFRTELNADFLCPDQISDTSSLWREGGEIQHPQGKYARLTCLTLDSAFRVVTSRHHGAKWRRKRHVRITNPPGFYPRNPPENYRRA